MKLNSLTPDEANVILHKGTERPYTGEYDDFFKDGTYLCRQCNAPLYTSDHKFDAHCGWPAFDQEIKGAVKHLFDPNYFMTGSSSELVCARCGAHLGHNFVGEHFTDTNDRHCVNSLSLRFVPKGKEKNYALK